MTHRAKASAILTLGLVVALATGCGDKMDPFQYDLDATTDIVGNATYEQHVRPILDANCIRCHASDNQGGDRNGAPLDINLDTYQGAFDAAPRANPDRQGGSMPPRTGGLAPSEKAIFQAWIDDGRLER